MSQRNCFFNYLKLRWIIVLVFRMFGINVKHKTAKARDTTETDSPIRVRNVRTRTC